MDYYNITWNLRDFLSNLPITGGLSVNDSSGWAQSGIASPITHKTPYGSWLASWAHADYGDSARPYGASNDTTITVYLESKVVHVWEARTDYVYDASVDKLFFNSYLTRDGSMAGTKDANGTFSTIASNCTIEIYNSTGQLLNTLNTANVSAATGFFNLEWPNTGLNTTRAYNGITQIDTTLGGKFRTPFLVNIVPAASLYNTSTLIAQRIDVPLSAIQYNITQQLTNQTQIIDTKMNQTVSIIQNETANMTQAVNATLSSFENRTYAAITSLQAGANQTLLAAQEAVNAAGTLKETAERFSWKGSVSPDPVLLGDNVTITVQGPAEARGQTTLLPLLDIYSWDNNRIINQAFANNVTITKANTTIGNQTVTVRSATYAYNFQADKSRFTPGKAYTYIVSEQVTGGMVAGSGMVESISLTTVAGLAAAAPEAERAAKKALDAIKAVEAVLVSGENINIAITLKNLKESVDALPGVLAKEGPSEKITQAMGEISNRIKKLAGDEGYDMATLLEKSLSASPAIKELRAKTDEINGAVDVLGSVFEAKFGGQDAPIVVTSVNPGSVRFRIVAINPSKIKTQKTQIKYYIPTEIKPKDVLDAAGLDLEYDSERSIYYVYKPEVELAPGEMRVFEVEVKDIWIVPENKLTDFKSRADRILAKLDKTEYYLKAKEIADTIYPRLEEISASQADESVSREQHIGIYRQNISTVEQIKEDIARMEKILVTAGGPPAPEMLAKTKIKAEEPTKTMTWIVIFIIIIFTGLLAAVLFFTWHRQARLIKEELLAAKKSAFPEPGPKEEEPKENP